MLISLTVGKVDAGVTVLLTPDKRLIEFPSILLPPDISSGSIVDITVGRNTTSESAAERSFRALQENIYSSFGAQEPSTPVLRCRNATQTAVVLEWDPIQLATADLISLALYRNGQKVGVIPRPYETSSTKISGLGVDSEYAFHLVLRTTAGTYSSEKVVVRTHKMTDLSGITITTGVLPAAAREGLVKAVERIGAKIVETVRIDTTHFVTTEGRGMAWEKAVEQNIPVVRPEWVEACEQNGRILGVTKFYLDAMRPAPGEETSAPAPQQPAVNANASQKDLPAVPGTPKAADAAAGASKENEKQQDEESAAKKEEKVDNDEEESDESEEDEKDVNPKSAVQEEQKMRLDEKSTQNLALRPGGSREKVDDDDDEDDAQKQKAPSPGGDGSSFQDVAL